MIIIGGDRSYKPLSEGLSRKHELKFSRFVHFWRFLWDKMANLGPIHFLIGLPIHMNANDGQNKVHILYAFYLIYITLLT